MSEYQKKHLSKLYNSPLLKPYLPPPYSEEEVQHFERDNEVILPSLLRYYLTNISDTIVVSWLPDKVELKIEDMIQADDFEPRIEGSSRSRFPFKFTGDIKTIIDAVSSMVNKAERLGLESKMETLVRDFLSKHNEWKIFLLGQFGCGNETFLALHPSQEDTCVYFHPGNHMEDLFQHLCGSKAGHKPWLPPHDENSTEHYRRVRELKQKCK